MPRFFSLVALACLAVGCAAPRVVQIAAPCAAKTTPQIITALAGLVAAEGMTITLLNENVGVLQASGALRQTDRRSGMQQQWQFSVRGDTVFAYAKTVYTSGALVTAELTADDTSTEPEERWYWNVRNGLQNLCGGERLLFIPQ